MRVLMIGDVVGRPGRDCIRDLLPKLKENYRVDFTIANCENAASGKGVTREVVESLFDYGIDVLTSGNHVWDKKEVFKFIDQENRLIRPANYPPDVPGQGYGIFYHHNKAIGIINLCGRVFMPPMDCPFRKAEQIIKTIGEKCDVIMIDFHAEATSEKMAFARYYDGEIAAVLGTHTHVQTADEQILPGGTAYITDVGMTGPYESVLGVETELVVNKYLTYLPVKFEVASGGAQFNAVLLEFSGSKCKSIERIQDYHDF